MRKSVRNVLLASAAAVALTLATALPASATSVGGTRSCTPPKAVSLSSVTQGTYVQHAYQNGQQFNRYPQGSVAYPLQTYSSMAAGTWSVYSSGTINYYAASCV